MEHFSESKVFLNEAHRILKPGGSMVLQIAFMRWVHEATYDLYRYTRYGLQNMFEKAGFTHITINPQTGFWVMWPLKFNYPTTRSIRVPWPIRKLKELLMRGIWVIDQRVAPWLDRHWSDEGETARYLVMARKA